VKEEGVKPYFIFNNKQINDIIEAMPRNEEELIRISGFGEGKAGKYGKDIIDLVNEYRR